MDYSMVVQTLWRISWQVAAVAVVVWVVTRLTRRAPAGWRYALWLIVLIKFFVPPFAYFPSELAFWQKPRAAESIHAVGVTQYASGRPGGPHWGDQPELAGGAMVPGGRSETGMSIGRHVSASDVMVILWIAGVCFMGHRLLVRFVRQVRMVRRSTPADAQLRKPVADCAGQLRLRRLPDVRICDQSRTPMVVGVARPTILLPPGVVESCNKRDARAMLLHELAHVKRLDMLVLWAHQLAQAVFFFHPAAWLAGHELKKERELACDELVLSSTGISPKEYASGYVSALKLASASPAIATSLGMAEPFDIEKRRLNMILRNAVPKLSGRWKLALTAAVVVALPTFVGISSVSSSRSGDASAAPRPAEIASALRNQEVACGASLELAYTDSWKRFDGGRVEEEAITTYCYTRTPDAFRVDVERDGRMIQQTFVDRDTNQCVQLDSPGSSQYAVLGKGLGSPFFNREFFETTRYLLGREPLCERVESGVVSEQMEQIDGHDCWRVEIPPDRLNLKRYVAWLDPSVGFNPRRIEYVWTDERPDVITFAKYEEITGGFWFPKEMVLTYEWKSGNRTFRQVNKVDSVAVGRAIPKEQLRLEVPSGMRVISNNREFTAP